MVTNNMKKMYIKVGVHCNEPLQNTWFIDGSGSLQ